MRNRAKAGNPVVVVLRSGEAELRDELRIRGVDATHLVDRHFPLYELGTLLIIGEVMYEEFATDLVLGREPRGVDGSKFEQHLLFDGEPIIDGFNRVVGDLVVVASVTEGRCELRLTLEGLFP